MACVPQALQMRQQRLQIFFFFLRELFNYVKQDTPEKAIGLAKAQCMIGIVTTLSTLLRGYIDPAVIILQMAMLALL